MAKANSMRHFIICLLRRIFPFITERISIKSEKNPSLIIEENGVWGRHVSSMGAFQSGEYPEGMWRAVFAQASLKQIRPLSILVLGSGAGSAFYVLQRIRTKENLSFSLIGVEWDPIMTRAGKLLYGEMFNKKIKRIRAADFPCNAQETTEPYHAGNITVVHCDAGDFFLLSQEKYPMIIIDLFNCFEVIPMVFEPLFIQSVYAHLEPKGHIIINAFNVSARLITLWQRPAVKIEKIFFRKNTVLWIC